MIGCTTATHPGSNEGSPDWAPVHRLRVSSSSHAVLTRGLGKRARDAFPTVHLGVCGDNQKVGTKTPKAVVTEGTIGPRPKPTVQVLGSGRQRVCSRISPWVEPCDIVVWHPGPQGSTIRGTIHDPRRKLTIGHKATSAKAMPKRHASVCAGF
jgi:hypothetical protein